MFAYNINQRVKTSFFLHHSVTFDVWLSFLLESTQNTILGIKLLISPAIVSASVLIYSQFDHNITFCVLL